MLKVALVLLTSWLDGFNWLVDISLMGGVVLFCAEDFVIYFMLLLVTG